MKTLLTVALICLMPLAASARIGETLEQCIARYGQPTTLHWGTHSFQNGGSSITCSFFEGKCIAINFVHFDAAKPLLDPPLTDGEIKELLEANGAGSKWHESTPLGGTKVWNTDSGLCANYIPALPTLTIFSQPGMDAAEAQQKKEDKSKVKGF